MRTAQGVTRGRPWLISGRGGLVFLALGSSSCDARIQSPGYLWLLWTLPLVAGYLVWAGRRRKQLLARFAEAPLLHRLSRRVSGGRRTFKGACLLAAIALLLLSLAGFQVGFEWEDVQRRGVDVVIALDTSDSMLVTDVDAGGSLSRLERAKREIQDLLDLMEGDRVALVAFAGTSFLELPLTLDYGAASLFLASMDTNMIPVKGTSIGSAIDTAVKAFEASSADGKALILITDGEDHDGQAMSAARAAKDAGVRIFPIGIGREEGAPIPKAGGGFRRDRSGEIIVSRLDEPTLQRIALETGGRYVRSVTGDMDLEQIYLQGIKASLEDRDLESGRRQRWTDRFQWLVFGAILLLMIEALVGGRGRLNETVDRVAR